MTATKRAAHATQAASAEDMKVYDSIELKEAAQQALKELGEARKIVRASSSRQLAKDWDRRATDALANLRAAIQQAEAKQPAAPEPGVSRNPFTSRCYTMSESHLSGHRLIVGFEKLGDAQDAHEWVTRQGRGDFTHPAPSVPDGYVLVPIEPTQAMMNVQTWDFSSFYSPREIWGAMLAAKDTK